MSKNIQKGIGLLLILSMLLSSISISFASEDMIGSKPVNAYVSVTDLILNYNKKPEGISTGSFILKGNVLNSASGAASIEVEIRYSNGASLVSGNRSIDELSNGTDFEITMNVAELDDGYYYMYVGDGEREYPIAKDISYTVYFKVEDSTLVDGWDTILQDPSTAPAGTTAITATNTTGGSAPDYTVESQTEDVTLTAAYTISAGEDLKEIAYQWYKVAAATVIDGDWLKEIGTLTPLSESSNITFSTTTAISDTITLSKYTNEDAGKYVAVPSRTESGKSTTIANDIAQLDDVSLATEKIPDTIAITAFDAATYGQTSEIKATLSNSGAGSGAVTYQSNNTDVASIDETTGVITLKGAGTTTITASKAADDDYQSTSATASLTVEEGEQTLSTNGALQAKINQNYELKGKIINDRDQEGGMISYKIVEANGTGATLNGTVIESLATPGTIQLTATAAAVTGKFNESASFEFTVEVSAGEPVTAPAITEIDGGTYKLGLTLGAISEPQFTVYKQNPDGSANSETVNGNWSWENENTLLNAGDNAVQAEFTPSVDGYAGITVSVTVQVAKANPNLTLSLSPTSGAVGATASSTTGAAADATGTVTYKSSDTSIATVDPSTGIVTAEGRGTATITATMAADTNYTTGIATATFETVTAPGAPSNVSGSGNGNLTVTWTPPADDGGQPITGYLVTVSGINKIQIPSVDVVYDKGDGTTQSAVLAETDYDANKTTSGSAVYVTIGGVAYEQMSTSAAVTSGEGPWTTSAALGKVTSFNAGSAINGQTYNISVAAVNLLGTGTVATGTAIPKESSSRPSGGGGGSSITSDLTVTFDAGTQGKITSGKDTVTVAEGKKVTSVPTVTANDGWEFKGWSTDGKTVIDPKTVEITRNTTFKAVYDIKAGAGHKGYMSGYKDGTFLPDKGITRAEVATMFANISDKFETGTTYDTNLTDVAAGQWYTNYVAYCQQMGWIGGYDDGSFKPDSLITRAEFSAIVDNYMGIANQGTSAYPDVTGHWSEGYIAQLTSKGIVTGYDDNTFRPDNTITRAEATRIMNGAFGRNPVHAKVDQSIGNYSVSIKDVPKSHWAYYEIMEAVTEHVSADFH